MLFICGLGNPGRIYKYTLHNLGFWVLDKLAEKHKLNFKREICNSKVANFNFSVENSNIKQQVSFVKPHTYMNLSGAAIFCLKEKYQFSNSELLIICDDFNLEKGSFRLKPEGGAGGHKGLVSIIEALQSEAFPRLRIGIGPLKAEDNAEEYVLKPLDKFEIGEYESVINKAVEMVEFYIKEGINKTMSFYNRKK